MFSGLTVEDRISFDNCKDCSGLDTRDCRDCPGPDNGDVASTSETSIISTGSNSPTTGSSDPAGGSSPIGEDSTPVGVMSEAYKTQAAEYGESSASLVRPSILGSIGLSSSGEESVSGISISIAGASLTTSAMSLTS